MIKILSVKQIGEFWRVTIEVRGIKYEAKFETKPSREYIADCWNNDLGGSDWKKVKGA